MVGNGWHLPSVGSWLMWVLSSTKKIRMESPRRVVEGLVEIEDDTDIECLSPERKIRRRFPNSQDQSPVPSPSSAEYLSPSVLWRSEFLGVPLD